MSFVCLFFKFNNFYISAHFQFMQLKKVIMGGKNPVILLLLQSSVNNKLLTPCRHAVGDRYLMAYCQNVTGDAPPL